MWVPSFLTILGAGWSPASLRCWAGPGCADHAVLRSLPDPSPAGGEPTPAPCAPPRGATRHRPGEDPGPDSAPRSPWHPERVPPARSPGATWAGKGDEKPTLEAKEREAVTTSLPALPLKRTGAHRLRVFDSLAGQGFLLPASSRAAFQVSILWVVGTWNRVRCQVSQHWGRHLDTQLEGGAGWGAMEGCPLHGAAMGGPARQGAATPRLYSHPTGGPGTWRDALAGHVRYFYLWPCVWQVTSQDKRVMSRGGTHNTHVHLSTAPLAFDVPSAHEPRIPADPHAWECKVGVLPVAQEGVEPWQSPEDMLTIWTRICFERREKKMTLKEPPPHPSYPFSLMSFPWLAKASGIKWWHREKENKDKP